MKTLIHYATYINSFSHYHFLSYSDLKNRRMFCWDEVGLGGILTSRVKINSMKLFSKYGIYTGCPAYHFIS